jgi:hypothetical protein
LVVNKREVVTGETKRHANESTINKYQSIWNQLRSFAVLREDY